MEDYVETGRFIAEREALRKEVLETTWSRGRCPETVGHCGWVRRLHVGGREL